MSLRNNQVALSAILAVVLVPAAIAVVFFYAPVDEDGLNQKIFYFHVPIALTAYACFGWGAWGVGPVGRNPRESWGFEQRRRLAPVAGAIANSSPTDPWHPLRDTPVRVAAGGAKWLTYPYIL